jgi:hypothetical protein
MPLTAAEGRASNSKRARTNDSTASETTTDPGAQARHPGRHADGRPMNIAVGEGSTPDRTALIMGGGTVSTPDDYLLEVIKNQYIEPTHPGQDIDYVPVTTPMEAWPNTGFVRLLGIAFGPSEVWGPGGAGWWPDEPWKLTGLFDLTADQAVQTGVSNLEKATAASGGFR